MAGRGCGGQLGFNKTIAELNSALPEAYLQEASRRTAKAPVVRRCGKGNAVVSAN